MKLLKLENLSKLEFDEIANEIADAFAQEEDGMAKVLGYDLVVGLIKICVEIYYRSGNLYTFDHTGYVTFFTKDHPIPLRYHFLMGGMMLRRLGFANVSKIMNAMKGWDGYQKTYADRNCLVLEMLAIPKKYQGQKKMRPLMNAVFQEADHLRLPCVLDTDAENKKNKYIRCGMKVVKQTKLPSGITVYVLEK